MYLFFKVSKSYKVKSKSYLGVNLSIDIKGVVGDTISGVSLSLLIIVFISVFVVFRNAIAHSGEIQATGIINQGIFTLVFIFGIIGVVGFIGLVRWVTRSFR